MAEFAVDHVHHHGVIEAGGVVDIAFGPPTAGPLMMQLSARIARVSAAPAPPGPSGPITPDHPETIRRSTPGTANPLRPGVGPEAGFTDVMMARRPLGPTGPRPGGVGGVLDPDREPPPPPSPPVDPKLLRVEIVDAGGTVRKTAMGPTDFDVPALPADPRGPVGGLPGRIGPRWSVRVTNTTTFRLEVVVNLFFHGHRPVLSREIDLDFLNEKLDLILNVPQPFKIALRNKEVARVPGFPIMHSFIALESSEEWRLQQPGLVELHEGKSLGHQVFLEETVSSEITLKATVHDGCLAFRARVAFPSFRGRIDVLNALKSAFESGKMRVGTEIVEFFTDLPLVDRPVAEIHDLGIEVVLVLRPQGVGLRPGPTFEVISQPRVRADPEFADIAIDALLRYALGTALAERSPEILHKFATSLLGWLLGERGLEVTGGDQRLSLQYAGRPELPDPVLDPTTDRPRPPLDPGELSKIDHIVVVMMENRSFDHMLGFLSLPTSGNDGRIGLGREDVNGLRGDESNPLDTRGNRHRIFSLATPRPPTPDLKAINETRGTTFGVDPGHSYTATLAQRGCYDIRLPPLPVPGRPDRFDEDFEPRPPRLFRVGRNEGFVLDFARVLSGHPTVSEAEERMLRGEVMGYYAAEQLPMYRFLAEQYTVCDNWFASHPGLSWPNRFVSLTGRLAPGRDGLPEIGNPNPSEFDPLEIPTIFDHLSGAGVEWLYFEHDFAMLRLFSKYTTDTEHVVPAEHPERGFFALAQRGELPSVVFIEPDLTDIPPGNDDHPPSDITAGQKFIERIYRALADSPQWEKTMLIITYDEHGGFFYHVHPKSERLHDPEHPEQGGFAPIGLDPVTRKPIDHYGFRVPTFVVSPWVPPASVGSEEYDHTTILKTIMARFLPREPPDMGLRVDLAKDLGPLLSLSSPRPTVGAPHVEHSVRGDQLLARRLGPPEEDFRTFMAEMRARLRHGERVDQR